MAFAVCADGAGRAVLRLSAQNPTLDKERQGWGTRRHLIVNITFTGSFLDLDGLTEGLTSCGFLANVTHDISTHILLRDACIKPSIMMYRFLDFLGAKDQLGLNQKD